MPATRLNAMLGATIALLTQVSSRQLGSVGDLDCDTGGSQGRPALEQSMKIARLLQHAALAAQLDKRLKAIHEDILGVYRFSVPESGVQLFWLPIAMFAAMLDVAIEDLTVVVLIHELGHGYTHLGRDIDGATWSDLAFGKSNSEVVEGLAQFYTEVVCDRLASRTPGLMGQWEQAFELANWPFWRQNLSTWRHARPT